MRVALCISGTFRAYEACCWDSIKKYLIDPTGADVFVQMAAADRIMPDAPAPHIYPADYPYKAFVIEPDMPILEFDYAKRLHWSIRPHEIQAILQQLASIKKCNQLRKAYEHEHGFTYDWVIRSRADVLYQQALPNLAALDPGAIYFPSFAHNGGLNDRFAMGGPEAMDIYSERIDYIYAYMHNGGLFHLETFTAAYLGIMRRMPIGIIDLEFPRVRMNGKVNFWIENDANKKEWHFA